MVDQMTRLQLKLLEKRLENKKHNMDDRAESASYDGQMDALHRALRRKQDLLQRLRLPQQPATIIQQLPPQQPLIAQIPPPHPYPAPRSGSIKEMVELMLMQNAQMHQIIMHNMMLKAMPPMVFSPLGGSSHCSTHFGQDSYQGNPIFVRQDVKPRGSAVHHHHHYGPTPAGPQLPPISYPTWLPGVSSVPAGQAGGHLSSLNHVSAPITLPPLN
uniref:Zgc:112416 n=1 Tax=Seriola lalandi dorsalis TaxID=1841481 RepID=A0A3B4XQZ0_SERLL